MNSSYSYVWWLQINLEKKMKPAKYALHSRFHVRLRRFYLMKYLPSISLFINHFDLNEITRPSAYRYLNK